MLGFVDIAKPLTKLREEEGEFVWEEDFQYSLHCFNNLLPHIRKVLKQNHTRSNPLGNS